MSGVPRPPLSQEREQLLVMTGPYTVGETAMILRVKERFVQNLVRQGLLWPLRQGVRVFFTRLEIERYLAACQSGPPVPETPKSKPRTAMPKKPKTWDECRAQIKSIARGNR